MGFAGSQEEPTAPDAGIRRARVGAAVCFLLTGLLFATWGARVPAVKDALALSDGRLALAFMGLNAGAIVGLQLGGLVVPRTGSRRTLAIALVAFAGALVGPALATGLPLLIAALFLLAVANSVVDVAMNAQGVAVERGYRRPVLSSMHAMHSLGGIVGAGASALVARLDLDPLPHFAIVAVVVAAVAVAASRLLLPSSVDAVNDSAGDGPAGAGNLSSWFRNWSAPIALLGTLAFCFTLAEGAALDWSAVYITDSLGGSPALGALGLGVFLAAVTVGRLAGNRLIARFGPVPMFRAGVATAGIGWAGALLVDTPAARLVGLGLLGAGISYVLPLAISAGSNVPGEAAATAAARVSTLAYLGSFAGPALIGGLASLYSLPVALAVPALLVGVTAFGASAVRPAERVGDAGSSSAAAG